MVRRTRGGVVDMGAPFGASATIASDGTPSEDSGPDPARGYTVIEAANLHDAVVMAKGCPGLSSGGSVKLYEAMSMGCRLPDGSSFLDSTTYWWTTLRRSASVDRSL